MEEEEKAIVEFAPDGEHYQKLKEGKIGRMWDYFNFNVDIAMQLFLNPQARFRLKNKDTGFIIGELPRNNKGGN